jgi:hypothetical protein
MEECVNSHGQHVEGLKAILAIRRQKEKEREKHTTVKTECGLLGQSIFAFMPQIQGLLQELRTYKPPSETSIYWVNNLNKEYGGARIAKALLQFGQVSARSHKLCEIVRQSLVEGRVDFEAQMNSTELMSLIQISEIIDQDNEHWHENIHPKWKISRRNNPYGLVAGGLPLLFLDAYHDLWTACVWNVSRAARIILMDNIIESAELLAAFHSDITQVESLVSSALKARRIMGNLVDDIRYSLPFICGQIDSAGNLQDKVDPPALNGICSLWPLNVLHSCKSLSVAERQRCRDILLDIGKWTGIRRAWALASRKIEVDQGMVQSSGGVAVL